MLLFYHFVQTFSTFSIFCWQLSSRFTLFFRLDFFSFPPLSSSQAKTLFWVNLSADNITVSSDADANNDADNDATSKGTSIAVASTTAAAALLASALLQLV